jgi:hypothetical protein
MGNGNWVKSVWYLIGPTKLVAFGILTPCLVLYDSGIQQLTLPWKQPWKFRIEDHLPYFQSCFFLLDFPFHSFFKHINTIVDEFEHWTVEHMGMDQYLLIIIPFLMGWTSIYQLFWCSPGVQGFDTLSFDIRIYPAILGIFWGCTDKIGKTHEQSYSGRGLASKSPVKWLWLNDLEIFWEYFHVFPECCVCLIHFPLLLVYMTTWACHDLSESRIPLNSMF